ncbi:carbohydrate ABC transporter permease [Puerhibacterium puerhi]|uniref:carbohydrate ABC transporter permease n=1 Tax=Puerhibacterium puerhi TaxID=2692623 RepID=UPI001359C01C|nr:sugar ABC transporter permease [Puerhibacterium puerhi]
MSELHASPPRRRAASRDGTADLHRRREGRAGYVFVAPTTLLLAVFYLWPLAQTVVFSFSDWNPGTGRVTESVGLENFTHVLTDPEFRRAVLNTLVYVVTVVPCSMGLGLVFAALLARPFRGRGLYRTLIFTPYIAPIVGSALIFSFLLTPLGGLVNQGLGLLGVRPIAFLTTEPWAMVSVVVFSTWQLVGYTMIIYSAALTNVPESYHEAATLDGAGPVRRFLSISLPLVAPTSGFLAITGVIGALQVFTQVYVLTGGGPLGSTETVLYWIYEQGFVLFNGGPASAAAVLLLVFGILASVLQLTVISRRDTVELS